MTPMVEPPDELDDTQRQAVIDYFKEHPDGGYKAACRAAGIRANKQDARRLIEADPEASETRERALGVDEDSAWARVAKIAKNVDHKDALRANTFILGAIHGRGEKQAVEITGEGGAPIAIAHERRLTLADVLADPRAARLSPGARGELPAARDVLADAAEREHPANPVPARPEP